MKTPCTVLAALLLALAASACGSGAGSADPPASSPTSVTQTIGPEGGAIVVQGATVTFPKGALAEAKAITIAVGTTAPEGYVLLSPVFECGPSGTEFAQPVTMQMPFTDDGQGGSLFWSERAEPGFKELGGRVEGKTVIAGVMHFSSGFVGRKRL